MGTARKFLHRRLVGPQVPRLVELPLERSLEQRHDVLSQGTLAAAGGSKVARPKRLKASSGLEEAGSSLGLQSGTEDSEA